MPSRTGSMLAGDAPSATYDGPAQWGRLKMPRGVDESPRRRLPTRRSRGSSSRRNAVTAMPRKISGMMTSAGNTAFSLLDSDSEVAAGSRAPSPASAARPGGACAWPMRARPRRAHSGRRRADAGQRCCCGHGALLFTPAAFLERHQDARLTTPSPAVRVSRGCASVRFRRACRFHEEYARRPARE